MLGFFVHTIEGRLKLKGGIVMPNDRRWVDQYYFAVFTVESRFSSVSSNEKLRFSNKNFEMSA